MNLRPLHNLYQTISPASLLEGEHPLVAVSRLERKGRTPTGEIQWVVGIGAKGASSEEDWWSARLGSTEVEELMKQLKGTAIKGEALIGEIRARWLEGRLDIRGLEESQGANERQPIELVIYLVGNVPVSIPLNPCESAPLSLLSVLAHVIPPYNTSSSSQTALKALQPQLASVQQERDKLKFDSSLLREELQELRKRLREGAGAMGGPGKRARTEGPEGSQGEVSSQSQGQSQRDRSAGLSPQKKGRPGIDFKAVMRPGTKGYAGSANRVGRNLEDEWEEPDSDSD
ncbi:hypothetical protein JCM16303_006938 [Sporobolomyces ruberrimus]